MGRRRAASMNSFRKGKKGLACFRFSQLSARFMTLKNDCSPLPMFSLV